MASAPVTTCAYAIEIGKPMTVLSARACLDWPMLIPPR